MQTQHRISYCHMEMEGLFFIGKPLLMLRKYSGVQGRVGLLSLQRKQQEWWWWQRDRASTSACVQSPVFCNSLRIAHWFSTDLPVTPTLMDWQLGLQFLGSVMLEVAIPIHQDMSCQIPLEQFANNHIAKSVVRLFFSFLFLKVQYNINFTRLTVVSVWLNGIKHW